MKKIILIIIISVICFKTYSQYQFSEYGNSTLISPSFVGIEKTKVSLKYRNQWQFLNTTAISGEHYLENYRSGIGAAFVQQKETGLVYNNFKLMYSYDFNITQKIKIRPALEFSYFWNSINIEKIYFRSQISSDGSVNRDASFYTDIDTKVHAFESSSSVLIYTDKLWFNVTLNNMFSVNNSFQESNKSSRFPFLSTYYFGYNILPKTSLKINEECLKIFAFYKTYSLFNQIDIGAEWSNQYLIIGSKIRSSINSSQISMNLKKFQTDAIIGVLGFKFQGLDFYYSYDFVISNLMSAGVGANEITINYNFSHRRNLKVEKL